MTMPLYAEVAIPIPLHQCYTYSVPDELRGGAKVGSRALVPFGPRRVTGYIVGLTDAPPEGVETKPISDLLDSAPLFDADMLALFRFVTSYYHESLGEVIRTALPAGQRSEDVRVVALTPAGRATLERVLDGLDGRDRRVLVALESGETAVTPLLSSLSVTVGRLVELERQGLVELSYRLRADTAKPKVQQMAVFVGEPSVPPVSKKEREVLEAVREATTLGVPVRELNRRFKSVRDNLARLVASGAIRIEERRVFRTPASSFESGGAAAAAPPSLTPEQEPVVARLTEGVAGGYAGFLLHGVTGSGKTEVYLHVIAAALEQGRGAIVLVPEIALTPQLVARFQARFGARIAVLHSGLSDGERLDQWSHIAKGELDVVVGARSAIFAPVRNLGVIVVDEEHEPSFKQEERPRYHARDLALVRGRTAGCPVILGSATPSLESLHNALQGRLELLRMRSRVLDRPLPEVRVVGLRAAERVGPSGILTVPLAHAMTDVLSRGEQTILFLNRRGFSSFVVCEGCGDIPECVACSISLSFSRERNVLRCHYCGYSVKRPPRCKACGAGALEPVGFGTERVEDDVRALFPDAKVARMDRDTTRGAALHKLLTAFRKGDIDVLIGTQMVAKGHDFPGVTLVGVLLADQGLKFPDFRASERTFQLLTQVAGRAGRGEVPGRVVIQSFDPHHYSLTAATQHDFDAFVEAELPRRRERDYPPFCHLAMLKITDTDPAKVSALAGDLARQLQTLSAATGEVAPSLRVLGPAWAPIQKIKNKVRAQILLKGRKRPELHQALALLDRIVDERKLAGVVAIDVDPVSLL